MVGIAKVIITAADCALLVQLLRLLYIENTALQARYLKLISYRDNTSNTYDLYRYEAVAIYYMALRYPISRLTNAISLCICLQNERQSRRPSEKALIYAYVA